MTTQGIDRIPDSLGYLVINEDGSVLNVSCYQPTVPLASHSTSRGCSTSSMSLKRGNYFSRLPPPPAIGKAYSLETFKTYFNI